MKLWKNFNLEKKYISTKDNINDIISFKSTNLLNHTKKNISNEKVILENKKSLNNSASLSSIVNEEDKEQNENKNIEKDNIEKEKEERTIQINLAKKKFNDLKILSTTSDDFFSNREKKQNMAYPTISNFNTNKKDNLFKIKVKKLKSSPNYNKNSLLIKWRENLNKLLNKSLNKTKREILQVLKKHKIKNIKKIFKKKNDINKNNETN